MKTNIRLLLAVAAMLAAPALGAQSHGKHSSSSHRGGRPEHHATVSGNKHSSGHEARPSRPAGSVTSRPAPAHRPGPAHKPGHAHRPAHGHRPGPGPAHRPSHPVPHRHHVPVLPSHAVRRYYNGLCYYFWDNLFYRLINGAYYVCDPPVGAIVYELPANYDIITMNGIRYYRVYNTLYNLVVDAYGKPAFEVVGYLNG